MAQTTKPKGTVVYTQTILQSGRPKLEKHTHAHTHSADDVFRHDKPRGSKGHEEHAHMLTLIAGLRYRGRSIKFDGARIAEGHRVPSRNTVELKKSFADATNAIELPLTSFSSLQTMVSARKNDVGSFRTYVPYEGGEKNWRCAEMVLQWRLCWS